MFALHDKNLLSGMELEGVTTQSIDPIHTGSSKLDLFLELFEVADGSVLGHIEYDSSLWQRASIVSLAAALNVSLLLILPCLLLLPSLMPCLVLFPCPYSSLVYCSSLCLLS